MPLISEEYRSLNEKLHKSNVEYGTSGKKWSINIHELAVTLNTNDILDYGCGKSTLANNLPFSIQQYDPAVPKYSAKPHPSDIVVCTDVLEHIEPENLEDVLDDLKNLTRKVGFFTVATRPAKKVLDDGRNAHLLQNGIEWWLPKFWSRFTIRSLQVEDGEFVLMVEARQLRIVS
jgi:hypothetical protein